METFKDIISGEIPVLVDFHAIWCGPCKAMSPIIDSVASENKRSLRVLKIDIDRNQSAAMAYGIQSVPTLLLFKKGEIVWRHSGALDKATLLAQIKYYSGR